MMPWHMLHICNFFIVVNRLILKVSPACCLLSYGLFWGKWVICKIASVFLCHIVIPDWIGVKVPSLLSDMQGNIYIEAYCELLHLIGTENAEIC